MTAEPEEKTAAINGHSSLVEQNCSVDTDLSNDLRYVNVSRD
jgi:hypothetical protein